MKYCPSNNMCGGCQYIHEAYESSLSLKQKRVEKLYSSHHVKPIIHIITDIRYMPLLQIQKMEGSWQACMKKDHTGSLIQECV